MLIRVPDVNLVSRGTVWIRVSLGSFDALPPRLSGRRSGGKEEASPVLLVSGREEGG